MTTEKYYAEELFKAIKGRNIKITQQSKGILISGISKKNSTQIMELIGGLFSAMCKPNVIFTVEVK